MSTHLLMDICVSSSWLLQIKLRWTSVYKSLCEHKLSFLLGNYLRVEWLGQTFPQSGCSTDIPTSGAGEFQDSTASSALRMVSLFHFRHSRYEMISHRGFCLHIPHWIEKNVLVPERLPLTFLIVCWWWILPTFVCLKKKSWFPFCFWNIILLSIEF